MYKRQGQDYWKYSGIERSVYLYARPQSRVKDFRMTAELINNYKDGELKLAVFLHQPKAGETVEVKVMDRDKVIYDRKKSITSATDTLFTQQQVFTNARAWNCLLYTSIYGSWAAYLFAVWLSVSSYINGINVEKTCN